MEKLIFVVILFFVSDRNVFNMFLLSEGLGRTAPDPRATVSLNGVDVPLGKGTNTNIDDTSLLYNEYPLVFWIICCLSSVYINVHLKYIYRSVYFTPCKRPIFYLQMQFTLTLPTIV